MQASCLLLQSAVGFRPIVVYPSRGLERPLGLPKRLRIRLTTSQIGVPPEGLAREEHLALVTSSHLL